jgi:tetratricopeptide (TPR) repeat protein
MPPPKAKKLSRPKAITKSVAAKNGKQTNHQNDRAAKPAPSTPPPAKAQFMAFERAIGLLHKRNFREAKELFEKARQGPSREIASNAALQIRICEQRLTAPAPEPQSAEEHYNYAIALMNLRDLEPARRYLTAALQMDSRADHVHYAMGICLALSGDASGAYDSLRRAIELQPRNRMVARQDSDLDGIANQPRFSRLFYPERGQ